MADDGKTPSKTPNKSRISLDVSVSAKRNTGLPLKSPSVNSNGQQIHPGRKSLMTPSKLGSSNPTYQPSMVDTIKVIGSAFSQKEASWEDRKDALEAISKLVSSDDFKTLLKTEDALQLQQVNDALNKYIYSHISVQILDPRSQVCRYACEMISTIVSIMGDSSRELVAQAVPALFKVLIKAVKVFVTFTNNAMLSIVTKCSFALYAAETLDGAANKHPALREKCCKYLLIGLTRHTATELESDPDCHLSKIFNVIKECVCDPKPDVRELACKCLNRVEQLWPEKYASIVESMDPTTVKQLKVIASKSSMPSSTATSTSVAAAPQSRAGIPFMRSKAAAVSAFENIEPNTISAPVPSNDKENINSLSSTQTPVKSVEFRLATESLWTPPALNVSFAAAPPSFVIPTSSTPSNIINSMNITDSPLFVPAGTKETKISAATFTIDSFDSPLVPVRSTPSMNSQTPIKLNIAQEIHAEEHKESVISPAKDTTISTELECATLCSEVILAANTSPRHVSYVEESPTNGEAAIAAHCYAGEQISAPPPTPRADVEEVQPSTEASKMIEFDRIQESEFEQEGVASENVAETPITLESEILHIARNLSESAPNTQIEEIDYIEQVMTPPMTPLVKKEHRMVAPSPLFKEDEFAFTLSSSTPAKVSDFSFVLQHQEIVSIPSEAIKEQTCHNDKVNLSLSETVVNTELTESVNTQIECDIKATFVEEKVESPVAEQITVSDEVEPVEAETEKAPVIASVSESSRVTTPETSSTDAFDELFGVKESNIECNDVSVSSTPCKTQADKLLDSFVDESTSTTPYKMPFGITPSKMITPSFFESFTPLPLEPIAAAINLEPSPPASSSLSLESTEAERDAILEQIQVQVQANEFEQQEESHPTEMFAESDIYGSKAMEAEISTPIEMGEAIEVATSVDTFVDSCPATVENESISWAIRSAMAQQDTEGPCADSSAQSNEVSSMQDFEDRMTPYKDLLRQRHLSLSTIDECSEPSYTPNGSPRRFSLFNLTLQAFQESSNPIESKEVEVVEEETTIASDFAQSTSSMQITQPEKIDLSVENSAIQGAFEATVEPNESEESQNEAKESPCDQSMTLEDLDLELSTIRPSIATNHTDCEEMDLYSIKIDPSELLQTAFEQSYDKCEAKQTESESMEIAPEEPIAPKIETIDYVGEIDPVEEEAINNYHVIEQAQGQSVVQNLVPAVEQASFTELPTAIEESQHKEVQYQSPIVVIIAESEHSTTLIVEHETELVEVQEEDKQIEQVPDVIAELSIIEDQQELNQSTENQVHKSVEVVGNVDSPKPETPELIEKGSTKLDFEEAQLEEEKEEEEAPKRRGGRKSSNKSSAKKSTKRSASKTVYEEEDPKPVEEEEIAKPIQSTPEVEKEEQTVEEVAAKPAKKTRGRPAKVTKITPEPQPVEEEKPIARGRGRGKILPEEVEVPQAKNEPIEETKEDEIAPAPTRRGRAKKTQVPSIDEPAAASEVEEILKEEPAPVRGKSQRGRKVSRPESVATSETEAVEEEIKPVARGRGRGRKAVEETLVPEPVKEEELEPELEAPAPTRKNSRAKIVVAKKVKAAASVEVDEEEVEEKVQEEGRRSRTKSSSAKSTVAKTSSARSSSKDLPEEEKENGHQNIGVKKSKSIGKACQDEDTVSTKPIVAKKAKSTGLKVKEAPASPVLSIAERTRNRNARS